MVLKIASWIAIFAAVVGVLVYFFIYDTITREPLRVLWVDSPLATDLRNVLEEFTDLTGVAVDIDSVPRSLYRESIERELGGPDPMYDLVIGDAVWIARDVRREYYRDIAPIIRDGWLFEQYDQVRDGDLFGSAAQGSGSVHDIPIASTRSGMLYRTDMIEDAVMRESFREQFGYELAEPKTLQQLTDIASFFGASKNGIIGVVFPTDVGRGMLTETYLALLIAQGGAFRGDDGHTVRGYLDAPRGVPVLEAMREWYTSSEAVLQDSKRTDGPIGMYASGRAAVMLGQSGALRAALQGAYATTSRIVHLPGSGEGKRIYAKTYVMSMTSATKRVRAAERLLRWLSTHDAQEFLQQESGASIIASVRDEAPQDRPYASLFVSDSVPVPFFVSQYAEEMLRTADNYIFDYIARKTNRSAQETLSAVADAWEQTLSEE